MGGTCPHCKTGNNWVKCANCGDVYCGACKKNRSGTKGRAGNVCPSCNKHTPEKHVSAPSWAK